MPVNSTTVPPDQGVWGGGGGGGVECVGVGIRCCGRMWDRVWEWGCVRGGGWGIGCEG